MILPGQPRIAIKRERLRSRFRVALLLAGLALLAGCTRYFGFGLTELAAERGWQPLPIAAWVLNEGLEPGGISYCPRESCTRPAMAALLTIAGREAVAMEAALGLEPARLAREFARPRRNAGKDQARDKRKARAARPGAPKSTTSVARFVSEGVDGLLVEIRARDPGGKYAATAILHARDGDRLTLAIAVSNDAEAARNYARAAWRSR